MGACCSLLSAVCKHGASGKFFAPFKSGRINNELELKSRLSMSDNEHDMLQYFSYKYKFNIVDVELANVSAT